MFVFAHLRKCAGTSVVAAAAASGLRLPPRHRNGHPAGTDGHAQAGLSHLSPTDLDRMVRPLVAAGVQFTALEWDVPRLDRFPTDLGLRFFTVLRDPVARFLSNYAYDVVSGFTASRTVERYLGEGGIWTHANYYTRFFAALGPGDPVTAAHVEEALDVLLRHVRFAFLDEDVPAFLRREVGLRIGALPRANRLNPLRRFLRRADLRVSAASAEALRAANALDYRLYDALRRARATRAEPGRLPPVAALP